MAGIGRANTRRPGRQSGRCTFLIAAALLLGGATPAAGTAQPAHAARGLHSRAVGVRFSPKVVMIPRSLVKANLVGISAAGVFKFKHATGPIARLRTGKVMLLQGADAVLVTGVKHRGKSLLVATKPAQVTDILSSGTIKFTGAPNFRNAVLDKIIVPVTKKQVAADAAFARPAYPYVGSPPDSALARPADASSLTAQGSVGAFGYSVSFSPTSPTHVGIDGTLCFVGGGSCANGPSTDVDVEVSFTGYIDTGGVSGGLTVDAGKVAGATLHLQNLVAHLHLIYTVSRGEGSGDGGHPPVFRVPFGLALPVNVGGVPIYMRIQVALLVKVGVSSKNAVIHGGLDVTGGGTDSITDNHGKVSDSESGNTLGGKVLDQSDGGVPPSISAAPSGVVIALQAPKIGIGLGYSAVNGIAYVDLINSIGQTVGSAVAGMFCSSYDVYSSIGAGLEGQIGLGKFGLALASPRKVLLEKQAHTHDPGCPQVAHDVF
ncbi:MAG: hypothetical protein ACYC91_07925 [Solirubrobacteraceae bacterium]